MSGVRTHCEVCVLEVDGKAVDLNAKVRPTIVVESDWRAERASINPHITLTIGETKYTVHARDLLLAAKHASET
jgi:hypothetical protein